MDWPALRFHPRPRIEPVAVEGRVVCHAIDDALVDPGAWRDFAVAQASVFRESPGNAFPGSELRLPDDAVMPLGDVFNEHFRRAFDARRLERLYARLSIVDRPPASLKPTQWQAHVDRLDIGPGETIAASVLYLFEDESLGGTAFYRPRRPAAETVAMIQDAATMAPEAFAARHGVAPGYQTASNAWFEKVASVPARWNRLIVYPGTIFHSGEIMRPEALDPHPSRGRLTLNAFFSCRRRAA